MVTISSHFWTNSGFLILLKDTWDLTSDLQMARRWDDIRLFFHPCKLETTRFLDLLVVLMGYFRPRCGCDCDLRSDRVSVRHRVLKSWCPEILISWCLSGGGFVWRWTFKGLLHTNGHRLLLRVEKSKWSSSYSSPDGFILLFCI